RWSGPATTSCCCGWKAPRARCPTGPTGCARCSARAPGSPTPTRGSATPRSRGATLIRRCCASACGRRACPRCSPRCPRRLRRSGWAAASRPSPCPRVPSRRRTPPSTPRAAPRCCAPARPGRTCPRGARHRPLWPCSARSSRPSIPTTASVPAVSTPGCDVMPGAFDTHRPPSRELLDDCVHCGFCLPTCPTYQLWGEEMDSPRGRIYLINLAEKGEIDLPGPFATHIDRCLGCMACVTACPSGVQYDRLLEATRPQLERGVERDKDDKPFRDAFARLPVHTPAVGPSRGRVALLTGCVQDVFFHRVNAATVRVLAAEGWDVLVPRDQ